MRVLIRLLVVCLAVVLVFCAAVIWRANTRPPTLESEILGVSIWDNDCEGQWTWTELDLRRGQLHLAGHGVPAPGKNLGVLTTTLDKPEVDAIRDQIAKAELKSLRPKAEWFEPFKGYCGGGTSLAIQYRSGEVVFAIPLPDLGRHLPDYAARRYDAINSIGSKVMEIRKQFLASGLPAKALGKGEEDRIFKRAGDQGGASLPRGRRGW